MRAIILSSGLATLVALTALVVAAPMAPDSGNAAPCSHPVPSQTGVSAQLSRRSPIAGTFGSNGGPRLNIWEPGYIVFERPGPGALADPTTETTTETTTLMTTMTTASTTETTTESTTETTTETTTLMTTTMTTASTTGSSSSPSPTSTSAPAGKNKGCGHHHHHHHHHHDCRAR
ncbi:hypothetical protein VTH06DRAFT_4942 [Thermothelomyces fergusii]